MTIDERRRFEWFLRYGVGMTLADIGEEVGRSREIVRQDLHILEVRCVLSWKSNKSRSQMPQWWRSLRDANAFSGSFYIEYALGWRTCGSECPVRIPPTGDRTVNMALAKAAIARLRARTNFDGPKDTGPHDEAYFRAMRADEGGEDV